MMVFVIKLLSLAPVSATISSSLSCFNGATLVLVITKQVLVSL